MQRAAFALAIFAISVSSANSDAAEAPTPNAALYYWQAFAALPSPSGSGDKLTEDERNRIDEWETAPLDKTTEAALKKHADSLVYLHRGAAISNCVWASQFDLPRDGIGTRVHQGNKARGIRPAALLRARFRFAHGQPRRALDDLFALMRLARHLEPGGTLVGTLLGYAIERDVIRVLASHMWLLAAEPELLTAAKTEWDKLPPSRPMVDALREERDGMVGMLRHEATVDQENPPDDELLHPIGFIPTLAFILGEETFEQAVATVTGTVGRHYDRLIQATSVSLDKIVAAEKAFFANWDKDTENDDPIAVNVAKMLLPGAGKLRLTEAELQTRRAMLRTAFDIAAEGADKLKTHTDPFGNAAFETRPVEGGYELKSALGKHLDKPLTLTVRTTRPKE
jgi:hypothetical protein